MTSIIRRAIVVVLVTTAALVSVSALRAEPQPRKDTEHHAVRVASVTASPTMSWEDIEASGAYVDWLGWRAWVAAVNDRVAIEAAIAVALTPPPPTYSYTPSRSSGNIGDCTGFAVPDYIITRESGGDPNARNASGAQGCTQIMQFWWNQQDLPGRPGCSDLDQYTVAGQRTCTQRIVDYSGLSAWSETR